MTSRSSSARSDLSLDRRQWLQGAGALAATAACGMAGLAQAQTQTGPKLRIGYWPVASGIPFFAAMEKGFFKEAGLNVEAIKFASPQQVVEAVLAGRLDGTASGTASAALGIGEIAQPGLFKIFCTNPTNDEYVLDEILVAKDSPIRSVADLKGKRVATGPGVQNVVIAKTILERGGAGKMAVVELPIGQHVAALAAGQVDAVYTLEPTGTVGRLNGSTRTLEVGVVSKYILGNAKAPWHGGSASLAAEFIQKQPDVAKRYIAAYRKGVELVQKDPAQARAFLKGYTAIEGKLTEEVPMANYMYFDEFKAEDVQYFQKFFDLFADRGVFSKKLDVGAMLYKG